MAESDVLIVGAGCFGLSTALHLKRRGVTAVTLLDRLPFPSQDSASNDTSRIVRADYPNSFYAQLGQEAIKEWRTNPTFSPSFHETGWLFAALPGDDFVLDSFRLLKSQGDHDSCILNTKGVHEKYPGLTGNMDSWDMYHNPKAGWTDAKKAMQSAMSEFLSLGGTFISGEAGSVVSLLKDSLGHIEGIKALDGTVYIAPQVIVCAGAYTPQIVATGAQIHPLGWCVAHWRLNAEEMAIWKDHPVVDLHRHGYFFPPNEEGLMKMGYGINAFSNSELIHGEKINVPRRKVVGEKSEIPASAEEGIRWILRQTAPELADKPFFDTKVCWDGMTADGHWLISEDPSTPGLYVAAGGSGHAFKFLPIIGSYIADLLQGNLDLGHASKWGWRAGNADPQVAIGGRPIKDLAYALEQKSGIAVHL